MHAHAHTHGYTAVTVGSDSSECLLFSSKGIKFCVRTLQNGIHVESLHAQWYMYTSAHMHARACTHTEVTVSSRSDCLLAVGSSDFSLLAVAAVIFHCRQWPEVTAGSAGSEILTASSHCWQ